MSDTPRRERRALELLRGGASRQLANYNLQRAHDANPVFHDVPTITLADGLRAVRLKLWDEDSRRLVTWSQAPCAL